jgi:hypothetical protein
MMKIRCGLTDTMQCYFQVNSIMDPAGDFRKMKSSQLPQRFSHPRLPGGQDLAWIEDFPGKLVTGDPQGNQHPETPAVA